MKSVRMITMKPSMLLLRAMLIGIVCGVAICVLLLLLAAAAIQASGKLPQDLLQPMILFICGISAFLAGFSAAKVSRKRGLLVGAGCGIILFVLCLFGGLIHSHEVLTASTATRLLVMVLAGALGGYLAMYKRQKIR